MEPITQTFQTHPFKVGQLIAGRYRVVSFLGSGSMGWVLKVEDQALAGATVALKILYPHLSRDPSTAKRFRQEVVLARQLAHPSIIHVHDFEEAEDGETFIALEYVDGASLDSILRAQQGSALPLDEAILILARVGEALLYAHQQGVLHRDLKPSNILIGRDGTIKLTDFGLAKSFQQEFGLTRTGEAVGTPQYMAPEQFRAEQTDQRADIYAFGVLAFELVTGAPPFQGDDFFALAEQHITAPFPRENKRFAATPDWFQSLVLECCEKCASARPLSMTEILPQLAERLSTNTQLTTALRHATPTARFSRRTQRIVITAIVFTILTVLAAVAWDQTNTKIFVCNRLLIAEYRLGIELNAVKRALGITGTLLRPATAFEALNDDDGLQVEYLLEADRRLFKDTPGHTHLADTRDGAGYTLLQRAAQLNLGRVLDRFYNKPLNFNLPDPNGETVLTASMKANRNHSVYSLFSNQQFRIDGADPAGDLPIHIGVHLGHLPAVSHMFTEVKNSGPWLRNSHGDHALHLSARLTQAAILKYFLSYGADPTVRDHDGRTVLMEAVRAKGPAHEVREMVEALLSSENLQRGVEIDALDNEGNTALMYALEARNELAVRRLIALGAKLTVRNQAGQSAQELAREKGLLHLLTPPP